MPKYKLNSGEVIDTSNFSEEEENNWLFDNTDNIDLNYDFQNGAVGTDASATPVNNPASNGDLISEDGSSDGVDPYSKFDITIEDLAGKSEEELVPFLNNKAARLGIKFEESLVGDAVTFTNKADKEAEFSNVNPVADWLEDSIGDYFRAVRVGKGKSEEELQAAADTINAYMREKGSTSFIAEARERSGERYENYLDYVTPEELSDEELLIEKRNATAEKFEEIKNRRTGQGKRKRKEAEIIDFASEKEFENYKQWEKTGIIGDFSKEDLLEYDAKRREKYINRKSLDYANDTDDENRIDILALAADDEEKIQTFELEANNYIALRNELDVAVENYKTNPSNNNYLAALDLQAKALADQGRIQRLQTKMLNSGIADRQKVIPLALSDFSKDYNRVSQLRTQFKNVAVDTGFFLAQLSIANAGIRGQSIASSPLMLNQLIEEQTGLVSLKEDLNKEAANFQRSIMVDEIRSVDEAGMWIASSAVNLIPSLAMAATGPAAMPLFFASSAGSKGLELALQQKEAISTMIADKETLDAAKASGIPLDALEEAQINSRMEKNSEVLGINSWKAYGVQALYGTAEMVFERLGTMSIIKNLSKGLPSIAPTSIGEGFLFVGGQLGKNAAIEGATEFFTTLAQNFGDIFILGEDKNIFEGALESFAQGALMGGGMTSLNVAKGLNQGVVSVLSTNAESKKLYSLLGKLKKLTGQNLIQGWGDVVDGNGKLINKDLDLPPEIKKQIDEVVSEMKELENGITYRIGNDLSIDQAYKVDEVNRKMRLINKRMIEASQNPNISPSQLKVLKDQFTEKIEALNVQREALLNDQADITSTKSKAVDAKFNVDNLTGWQSYTFSMARASLGNVLQHYENLPEAEKQKALADARAELETKSNTPTSEEVNVKAKLNFIKNEYKAKILKGAENAKKFAESKGLDTTFEVFEGKDADKKLLEWAENNSEELVDRKKFEDQDGIVNEKKYQAAIKLELANIKKGLKKGGLEGFNTIGNTVVVHLENSAANGRTGIFAHEVLHSYIRNKYGDDAEIDAAGKNLLSFLEKNEPDLYARVTARVDSSYTTRNKKTGELEKNKDYYEEVMTAMSDVLADGQSVSKDLMYRLKKFVNSFLPAAHRFKDDQAREVYEFVKSYNSVAHFGKEDTAGLKKGVAKNVGLKASRSRKLTEAEEDRMEAIDQEIDEIGNDLMQGFIDQDGHDRKIAKLEEEYENIENPPKVEAKPKPKAKRKAKSPNTKEADLKKEKVLIGDAINKMIPDDMTLDEWPKVAGKIVEAFQKGMLLPLFKKQIAKMGIVADNIYGNTVQEFYDTTIGVQFIKNILNFKPKTKDNPQGNDDFAGYIIGSTFGLNNRIKEALAKLKKGKELNEASDVSTTKGIAAEESSNEVKEKPKYRSLTEAGVVPGEVINAVKAKLKTVLRTLKSRMDAAITNNRTVTPLMAEIQYEMGKQADIDLKTAMGGKKDGQLRKFLLRTKKAVLQNMTTTWLMGKDGVGGIPQAIQKKVDGKWVSYPDWVGKKIDREKTSTDNAGRTSGALLVRRHPSIVNYKKVDDVINDETYLAQFLQESGNPIRGRKEALAKAMAEEISFEIFSAEIANPGSEISEAFKNNQKQKEVVIADNLVEQIQLDVDRGNIKFSMTITPKAVIATKQLLRRAIRYGIDRVVDEEGNLLKMAGDGRRYSKFPGIGEVVRYAYDNGLFPTADAKRFLDKLKFTQKIPYSVREKAKNALSAKKSTKEQLDNFAREMVRLGLLLGRNVSDKVGYDGLGFINRLLDPAAKKTGGGKGIYNNTLNELRNMQSPSQGLPKELDMSKVHPLHDKTKIVGDLKKLLAMDITANEKRDKYKKEILPRVLELNKHNKILAKHIIKTAVRAVNEGIITEEAYINMLQAQTGATRGLRSLTGLSYISFKDGPQLGIKGEHLADNSGTMLEIGELPFLGLNEAELDAKIDDILDYHEQWYTEKTEADFIDIFGRNNRSKDLRILALPKANQKDVYSFDLRPGKDLIAERKDAIEKRKKEKEQEFIIQKANIKNEAITKGLKYSKSPKGISVFDFDDTLARTKSNVLYVMPDGKKGKLNAAQFAAQIRNIARARR